MLELWVGPSSFPSDCCDPSRARWWMMKFLVVNKNCVFVALFLDTIPGIVMLMFEIEKNAIPHYKAGIHFVK